MKLHWKILPVFFWRTYGLIGTKNIAEFHFDKKKKKKKMILKLDFIAILSFRKSLAKQNVKCISLNDHTCLAGPMPFDLNEDLIFSHYLFKIEIDRSGGNCN